MTNDKHINDDRVFLLRGEHGEIIYIDDPGMCARLDAKVAEMEAKGFDEMAIGNVLRQMIKTESDGR